MEAKQVNFNSIQFYEVKQTEQNGTVVKKHFDYETGGL